MAEEKKVAPIGIWTAVKPFVNGGASGMLATCVIQPIDMIKVRIQLGQGSAASVTTTMLKNEGIGAFYKGLSAGLLRQATYTTARLGSFKLPGLLRQDRPSRHDDMDLPEPDYKVPKEHWDVIFKQNLMKCAGKIR